MILRRQKPPKFTDYRKYKPFLRIDFEYRCAYCGITEYRWGSERNFAVEHFRPKSRFKHLAAVYSNLYYACNRCNDFKGNTWPTAVEVKLGRAWADPCLCDVYVDHLRELPDGRLQPLTPVGEYTAEHLLLNLRPYLVVWRRERSQLRADVEYSMTVIAKLENGGALAVLDPESRRLLATLIARHKELCTRLALEY